MKKEAINWPQIGTAVLTGFAAAGTGVFIDEMLDWLKENRIQWKSQDYYQAMLDAHPQLKKEDPKIVAKYWASLYHFAPYMAQDPLAAGAYIRQTLRQLPNEEFGGPTIDTYSTLTNINKAVADVKQKKTRGIATEIGVGASSKVVGDTLSGSIMPQKKETINNIYTYQTKDASYDGAKKLALRRVNDR